jgi:predicted MFS family arabinose efflux permease
MPSGMALAMLTGPWFNDWRQLWTATAMMSALIAAMAIWVVPRGAKRPEVHARRDGWRQVWRSPARAMAGTFLLYSLMFFALFAFLPVLLQQRMQVSTTVVGLLAAAASAVNVVGNLAAAPILKRVGREVLCRAAAIVMGLCALGIFLPVAGPSTAFALCLAFSAVGGLIPASLLSAIPEVTSGPDQGALAAGLLMQGSNLGLALGPLLIGSAVDSLGWSAGAAWVVASALAMAATVSRPRRAPVS